MLLVVRAVYKGYSSAVRSLYNRPPCIRIIQQFTKIMAAEFVPPGWIVTKPLPQLGARSNILEPVINFQRRLFYPPGHRRSTSNRVPSVLPTASYARFVLIIIVALRSWLPNPSNYLRSGSAPFLAHSPFQHLKSPASFFIICCIELCKVCPFLGDIAFRINRLYRADGNACATINTFDWVDIEHRGCCEITFVLSRMNAINGASSNAGSVFDTDTRLSNDECHY